MGNGGRNVYAAGLSSKGLGCFPARVGPSKQGCQCRVSGGGKRKHAGKKKINSWKVASRRGSVKHGSAVAVNGHQGPASALGDGPPKGFWSPCGGVNRSNACGKVKRCLSKVVGSAQGKFGSAATRGSPPTTLLVLFKKPAYRA